MSVTAENGYSFMLIPHCKNTREISLSERKLTNASSSILYDDLWFIISRLVNISEKLLAAKRPVRK